MAFTGRIHIRELEKKPVEMSADQQDAWITRLLERAAPSAEIVGFSPGEWATQSTFATQFRIEKIASDYLVTGNLKAQVPAPCSRCGDDFKTQRAAEFRVVMHRLEGRRRPGEEDSGDPDYVFFEGDEIDVLELLAEQLIANEPVAESPPREPSGKCQLCGKNPQFVSAEEGIGPSDKIAGQTFENSAFSALSKLGVLTKKQS